MKSRVVTEILLSVRTTGFLLSQTK